MTTRNVLFVLTIVYAISFEPLILLSKNMKKEKVAMSFAILLGAVLSAIFVSMI